MGYRRFGLSINHRIGIGKGPAVTTHDRRGGKTMTPLIPVLMLLAPVFLPVAPSLATPPVVLGAGSPAVLGAGSPILPIAAPRVALSGTVREIVDGDTLTLASGARVRLVGIQAPKLPLGRPGYPTWPLAHEAKAALAELAMGKRLRLAYTGRRIDRHGRLLAHLFDAEGRWIQGVLLARGMARVYTFPDNRARGGVAGP
jgi:endonuclease YncB( thermonuclease family)